MAIVAVNMGIFSFLFLLPSEFVILSSLGSTAILFLGTFPVQAIFQNRSKGLDTNKEISNTTSAMTVRGAVAN